MILGMMQSYETQDLHLGIFLFDEVLFDESFNYLQITEDDTNDKRLCNACVRSNALDTDSY